MSKRATTTPTAKQAARIHDKAGEISFRYSTHPTAKKIREQTLPERQDRAFLNLGALLGFIHRIERTKPAYQGRLNEAARILGLPERLFEQMMMMAAYEIEGAKDNFHLEILADN